MSVRDREKFALKICNPEAIALETKCNTLPTELFKTIAGSMWAWACVQ